MRARPPTRSLDFELSTLPPTVSNTIRQLSKHRNDGQEVFTLFKNIKNNYSIYILEIKCKNP